MRRKAFLIGSPFEEGQPGYLPGVTPDIVAMKAYFKSLHGGAWADDEIQVFNNPKKSDLQVAMQASYDFVVVQYSGHGFEYKSTGTQLDINPTEKLSLEEMHHWINAPRRYYFLDCCRGVVPLVEKSLNFSMESRSSDSDLRPTFRKKYEDIIESCELGASIIYSCGMNESADEDPSGKGGIFTVSYLSSAKTLQPAGDGKYYSIQTVFENAKAKLNQLYPSNTQNPEMKPERRNRYFPFVL